MATTARGIVYPTVGTTLTPLANHFASLATSTNTALDNLDNGAMRYAGLDSARAALTAPKLKEGLEWFSTDTDRTWFYDGSNWISAENGMYLLRPSSVTAGTINADGTIVPSGAASAISMNGIFSSRYRRYRIEFFTRIAAASSFLLRLRNAGADVSAASYATISTEAQGTTATVFSSSSNTFWNTNNANNSRIYGHVEISNPGTSATDATVTYTGQWGGFPEVLSLAIRQGYLSSSETSTYDGISFVTASGTPITAGSWFKVYALA